MIAMEPHTDLARLVSDLNRIVDRLENLPPNKVLLKVAEAADRLSISETMLRRLHREGEISFTQISPKCVRVHVDEVAAFARTLSSVRTSTPLTRAPDNSPLGGYPPLPW